MARTYTTETSEWPGVTHKTKIHTYITNNSDYPLTVAVGDEPLGRSKGDFGTRSTCVEVREHIHHSHHRTKSPTPPAPPSLRVSP